MCINTRVTTRKFHTKMIFFFFEIHNSYNKIFILGFIKMRLVSIWLHRYDLKKKINCFRIFVCFNKISFFFQVMVGYVFAHQTFIQFFHRSQLIFRHFSKINALIRVFAIQVLLVSKISMVLHVSVLLITLAMESDRSVARVQIIHSMVAR